MINLLGKCFLFMFCLPLSISVVRVPILMVSIAALLFLLFPVDFTLELENYCQEIKPVPNK